MDKETLADRYQLVLIETDGVTRTQCITETVKKRIQELGFDNPDAVLSIFDLNSNISTLDFNLPTVGVWFGSDQPEQNSAAVSLVEKLLQYNKTILPVVDSLVRYQALTPKALHPINGMVWNRIDDPDMTIPAVRVQEYLGFLPARRQAFISYFRQESTMVARQLHNALIHSTYDVFLDSCDVPPGIDFQEVLRHRLTDSDLLILLYTPGSRHSSWVREEIQLANKQGIGVLQLVWPGAANGFNDFSDLNDLRFYLDLEHFVDKGEFNNYAPHPSGQEQLKSATLHQLVTKIEIVRAQSLFNRRKRLLEYVHASANLKNIHVTIRKATQIDLQVASGQIAHLLLCTGVPDALTVYEHHQKKKTYNQCAYNRPYNERVLYNRVGISHSWQQHLKWLNDYLPLPTLALTEVDEWLKHL